MPGAVFLDVADVERVAVLVGVDRLVLGAVVLEYALDIGIPTDEPYVADDQEDPQQPIEHDEQSYNFV